MNFVSHLRVRSARSPLLLLWGILICWAPAYAVTNLNINLISNARPSPYAVSYGDVWAENGIACLGVWLNYNTYTNGVAIYSISNPANPVLLSVYNPLPLANNQFELGALRSRIGYFGSWSGGGLRIVLLTNPARERKSV